MADNRIGVRELVELTVRTGDLDPVTTNSNNTAMLGASIHRRLQAAHDGDYEKEVYLAQTVTVNGVAYTIDGRADGVDTSRPRTVVEEIKTSARDWADVTQNTKDRYWAQARVYGHFLCDERDLDEVELDLIYYQTNNDHITRFTEVKTAAELANDFQDLLNDFGDWLKMRSDIVARRDASIDPLPFPFPVYRKGQRELAAAVYRTVANSTRLFVEAPTGTGKTISTLFPVIKAMGAGLIQRTFYLTAKQSTRHVAEEAMALMTKHGLHAKSITLTAKDTITFADEPDDPSINPYMLGYYDRLKPALKDLLGHEDAITRPVIEQYAKKHTLDPFEFSLDVSLFCDVIICDYNYLFDPAVFLQRFFAEPDTGNFFLIDEAHNLVARAREMYSAELLDTDFATLRAAIDKQKGKGLPPVKGALSKVLTAFDAVRLTVNDQPLTFQKPQLDDFIAQLTGFTSAVHDWLGQDPDTRDQAIVDQVLPVFFSATSYLRIADYYNDAYETEIENAAGAIHLKELCLDPSQFISDCLDKGRGAVLFSATLSPLPYYQDILGGRDQSLAYRLPSPFPQENLKVLVTNFITPTYRNRESSLPALIASLTMMVSTKAGHYLVFLPSHSYLTTVFDAFKAANPDLATVVQGATMTGDERTAFLARFRDDPSPVVGFAVLGGIFSEGIDLGGDQLIGVAIVTVGLPGLNAETDRLRAYFDAQGQDGFAYAYQLPGFNNVLQAGGRVIRGAKDVGVVLLADSRFAGPRYAPLFPPHWTHATVATDLDDMAAQLTDFWEAHRENTPNA
ncbi:ATP-dependent DNA helicase [Lacticaseibacillus hegangensis]|uniref:ATP-dependent DNA helicase n=1 Tax=Lacticaseibacillus hegangensis TaxID=2486010 RepID=A0ABW4CV21_9LACO|nr:ATP-dependent DNA helicase [Lacticaseibacillus hegangensis]